MRSLLVLLVSLAVFCASAQSRKSDALQLPQQLSLNRVNFQANAEAQEALMRSTGTPVAAPVRNRGPLEPFYRRPAGAFYCSTIAVDGVGGYSYPHDFVLMKPYAPYTFYTSVSGADDQTFYAWGVNNGDEYLPIGEMENLTFTYGFKVEEMPVFYVADGDPDDPETKWYYYQMPYAHKNPIGCEDVGSDHCTMVYAIPDPSVFGREGVDYLLSSKTTCRGGRYQDLNYVWTYFPMGGSIPEERWWWFGKNDQHIDGMAQAFEKPEHPYLLKKVYMAITRLNCLGPVKLNCWVYRLDEIPSYKDGESVALPDEPGTLIAFGEGLVTPTTDDEKGGLVEFLLLNCEEDDSSLVYEVTPTIDYPILVVIDGYNDPEAADLLDFTAYISADYLVDEGYGETAYLKCPINDDEGNFTGTYEWRGLNYLFNKGMMKTAFSIFIVADQPFVKFYWPDEDGEYCFPREGGELVKDVHTAQYPDSGRVNGIRFVSWTPSEDDDWEMLCNGEDVLPDWLEIELFDDKDIDGEFNGLVTARVIADPLPENVSYREAIVRFQIPGDYIDYKFIQGVKIPVYPCFDDDGEINIGDLNRLIDFVIEGMYDNCADLNGDGEVNLADVNTMIDIILSN